MIQKTAEQRKAENIAFMNEPCKFRQYINDDGTVGKTYKLQNGATVKINNADFIPIFEKAEREFRGKSTAFHDKLFAMGAKAYRVNDGWVDRKRCQVTFFDEKDFGFYWGSRELKAGDLIFIGTESDGGRFAKIIDKVDEWRGSVTYSYTPTETTIDGEYSPYKTKNNLTKADKLKMFLGKKMWIHADIYNEES